jgi:hypothetical protein
MPDALYKYVTFDAARTLLESGKIRWHSPELLSDPWFIGFKSELGFDASAVNKAMLNTAVSMLFTRDIPNGNKEHPLYRAICRWRAEDRFKDETEAFDALSELLAPTPETLQQKLQKIVTSWQELVSNARVVHFSDTLKDMHSWERHADQYRGLVLRFDPVGNFSEHKPVEYSLQRPHLTTIREQVNDLVGIERAAVVEKFESKLLTKPKHLASEREWRCIRVLQEEDLDCGEDIEDWYMDEPLPSDALKAVYFGFKTPPGQIKEISDLISNKFPDAALYVAKPVEEQFELEFEKFSFEAISEAS